MIFSIIHSCVFICVDRPSPPEGPLDVSNVRKDGCRLTWKIPLDDGGAPILHYVIEKMDISRGTWSDAGMTTSLYHDVIRLIHKREYLFRVKAVNSIGESDVLETDKSIIARNEFGMVHIYNFLLSCFNENVLIQMNLMHPRNQW